MFLSFLATVFHKDKKYQDDDPLLRHDNENKAGGNQA